jgi:predicted nucleic acid-binding protein
MRPVIVDSNKFFSALLRKSSGTRRIITESDYEFFAPNYLIAEIFKHKEKLLRSAKVEGAIVQEFLVEILRKIEFVNEKRISNGNLIHAYRLCKDIDKKDILFAALTLELDGRLWTGDEELKRGLLKKGFTFFFDPTEEF